jgi:HK97 family phage portal protein
MANILTRWIDNQVERAMKAQPITREDWLLSMAEDFRWNMPDLQILANQENTYRTSAAVSTAVEMVAQAASMEKLNVYRLEKEQEVDIPNHEFELLYNKPNPMQSGAELTEAAIGFRKLSGNFYCWQNKENENAKPIELWVIPPDRIEPIPDDKMYIKGYVFKGAYGEEIPLETWEVMHWRRFNPFNPFIGLSAIEALAYTIFGTVKSKEWITKLYGENNARLPGILAFKQLYAPTDWTRMQRMVLDAAAKREFLMLNGVGDKVDWQQAAATGRDMQLIELMNLSTTEVWNSLAPGLNGMLSIEANRSNSETGERTFKNFSIYPMHFGLAAKMTHDILPAFGDNLVCRFDDVRVTDRALRIKEQEAYERVHPIDEVRQEFYQDDPIGDERGNKLVAEIKSQASPFGQPPLAEEARDVEQDKEERDNKAYLEEMGKFRRYALKRIGKEMKFTSNIIPSGQLEGIAAKLKGCGTEKAVNTIFDGYLDGETDNGAADVIKGMALAVEAIKAVTMFKKEQ